MAQKRAPRSAAIKKDLRKNEKGKVDLSHFFKKKSYLTYLIVCNFQINIQIIFVEN